MITLNRPQPARKASPTAAPRAIRSAGFILAVYLLLSLVLTYPLLFHLAEAVPSDIGDPLLNTWILAWVDHALLADPLNLFNANIFYPLPGVLAYSEHLLSTALLILPVQLISGEPLLAYNLSLLASFPLAGLGMYLLALRWTGRRDAAFLAGLIFAFNPYRFAAIAHLQLLTFQWLPFTLLSLDLTLRPSAPPALQRSSEASPPRPPTPGPWPLFFTLFLTLQLLASWYLAVYTMLILGLFAFLLLPVRRAWPALSQLGLVGALCALLILPIAWPYLALAGELQAARPLAMALSLAAAPADYAAAAPFNQLFGPLTAAQRARPGFVEENTLFPGLVAVLLGLAGGWTLGVRGRGSGGREREGRVVAALVLVLGFSLALTLPGPYRLLAAVLPASTIVRVPARWVIPALFALAGLAAFGYAWIWGQLGKDQKGDRRKRGRTAGDKKTLLAARFFVAFLALLLLAESLSAPLPLAGVTNQAGLNPAYRWLAAQPGPPALVELPLHSAPAPEYPEVKRLYASTLGWWKLVNGYSGYTPPRQPELARLLAGFPDGRAVTALQELAGGRPLYLLVHPGEAPFERGTWEDKDRWVAERNPALRPVGQFEGDYLYEVRPPDPARFAPPPLATFGGDLQLLGYELSLPAAPLPPQLILYWQARRPLPAEATVFIHFRAADGFVKGQADGPMANGHYPATAWGPGEIVQDTHLLPPLDWTGIDHLAVGLYDPNTGERWPAVGPDGARLAEETLQLPARPAAYP